jgi:hypothetical protein
MVGSSKRFVEPEAYTFSLAAYATFNAGGNWYEARPLSLPRGWGGISDPAMAFDGKGNAYLVTLPFPPGVPIENVIGIAVYQSPDGVNWGPPNLIHEGKDDDKQCAASDGALRSKFFGNVYAAWDNLALLAFARTVDNGQNWTGVGNQPVGTPLAQNSWAPAMAVAPGSAAFPNSSLYIVWGPYGDNPATSIYFVKSNDGGASFSSSSPDAATVATGITPLVADGTLPGGTFRVYTFATVCAVGDVVVVAWADNREGSSRIYHRRSVTGGRTWEGDKSGQPLLTGNLVPPRNLHHFHPQLAANLNGDMVCSFYEFGPTPKIGLINVIACASDNGGASFNYRTTVTDRPWDPAVDAPLAEGGPETFIGDYFGLASSDQGFFPFWTDTRTSIQEVFTARVGVTRVALDGYETDFNQQQHVNFIGVDNHVHELVFNPGAGWSHHDLTRESSGAPPVVPGSPLDGYTTPFNQQQHVNFIGVDNHVHELVFNPGAGWSHHDLTAESAGAPPAIPGSPLDGYTTTFNAQQHVNYLAADSLGNLHVHELVFNPGAGWSHHDLTTDSPGAPPASPVSPLDGYTTPFNQQQHVNYLADLRGSLHVHELVFNPGAGWSHHDLTAESAGAPSATPGSPLDGYTTEFNQQQHVNFIGLDNHVHELVFNPGGGWSHHDLTAESGAPLATPGSPLDGYVTPFNQQQHVNFVGLDNHVHELVFNPGSGWSHHDLTAESGAPSALQGTHLDGYTTVSNQQQHVNFVGEDHHVHELVFSPGSGWNHFDLTASTAPTDAPDVLD